MENKTSINWFHIVFPLFLFIYFAHLLPYAKVLFSPLGYVQNISDNWTIFSPYIAPFYNLYLGYLLLCLGMIGSILLYFRIYPTLTNTSLLLIWIILYNINNLLNSPLIQIVGWLLFMGIFEKISKISTQQATWTVFGAAYFFAAISKLQTAAWVDGHIAASLQATITLKASAIYTLISHIPFLDASLTYFILILQLSCILTYNYKPLRVFGWCAITIMHILIFCTLHLYIVALAGLMVQLYLMQTLDWKFHLKKANFHYQKLLPH